MAGQTSRRMTLGVGQSLQTAGAVTITLVRANANGSVVLDVAGQASPQIDRTRRPYRPLRKAAPAKTR